MGLVSFLAVVATIAASDAVEVRSDSDCPSSDAIAVRVRPLLSSPAGTKGAVALIDTIETHAQHLVRLRLRLVRLDGGVVGDRPLVVQGDCAEMAEAVASVVATWTVDFPQAQPFGVTEVAGPAVAGPAAKADRPGRAREGFAASIGVAAGLALVAGAVPAAGVESTLGQSGSRWRLRLAALTQASRTTDLEVGQVSWRHTSASVGVMMRTLGSPWHLALDLGPTLGWASLDGQGYPEDRHARALEYGLEAGARVEWEIGHIAVWLDGRFQLWRDRQEADLVGTASRVTLPAMDVFLRLGTSATLIR